MNGEGSSAIRSRRGFLVLSTTSFVTVSVLALYLYRFALFYSATVSNALLIVLVSTSASALFLDSVMATTKRRTVLVLFAIGLFAFLVRAVPSIRLDVPFLHDSYTYGISMQDIYQGGTLTPALAWWYPQVAQQLNWPLMQILTVELSRLLSVDPFWLIRFQEPLLGPLTSVAVFMLARTATGRDRVSLIAALFASSSDLVIYYQAEYHPQGFVLVVLAFFLYVYLKSRSLPSLGLSGFSLVLACDLVFIHHFSALLIAILAVGFVTVSSILDRWPRVGRWINAPRGVAFQDFTLWTLVGVAVFSYYIFISFSTFGGFIRLLQETQPTPSLVTVGASVPITATLLNAVKWGVLPLALIGAAKSTRIVNPALHRLMLILGLLLIGGAASNFITGGPTDRLIAVYSIVASVFASVAVGEIFLRDDMGSGSRGVEARPSSDGKLGVPLAHRISSRSLVKTVAAGGVVLLFVGGAINVPLPAYYFHGLGQNGYYWSSDDLSSAPFLAPTGTWIRTYVPNGTRFTTEFDTVQIPFYYAQRTANDIRYVSTSQDSPPSYLPGGYFITNPSIAYYYGGAVFRKEALLNSSDVLYSNGAIVVSMPGY